MSNLRVLLELATGSSVEVCRAPKKDCSDCPSLVVRVETCARAPYEETNCRWHTAAHRASGASGAVPPNALVKTKAYDKRPEERNEAFRNAFPSFEGFSFRKVSEV